MLSLSSSRPQEMVARLAGSLRQIGERHVLRSAARRQHVRIASELAMASDRELAELGFSRADLGEIARGTYRR